MPDLFEHNVQSPEDSSRALPHALGAEKSILSSLLQDPQNYLPLAVENKVLPSHFYQPSHGELYKILIELFEKNAPIELISLIQTLEDRKLLPSMGGAAGIADIFSYTPTHAHFPHHLQIIKEKNILRCVITQCTDAISRAYDEQEEIESLLDNVESQVLSIRENNESSQEESIDELVRHAIKNFEAYMAHKGDSIGLSTGYPELDKMCNGLKAGEMFIIAARPSMGKTSFAMNLVEHFCLDFHMPSMVFSLEMTATQIVERLLFARARFDKSKIMRGVAPTREELINVTKAAKELEAAKLFIDDTPSITINELRAKARRKKKQDNIGVIAVDYLQLMRSTSKQAQGSREREVAEISAGLKALAKELDIPIVVLAQLNRSPETRVSNKGTGGKPRMSDLRESGSIEQDADMIGLLYRDLYYAQEEEAREQAEGKSLLIIAKNRNGPTGDIPLTFIKEIMRFETRAWDKDELPS